HRRIDLAWPGEGELRAKDGGACALAVLGWLEAACRAANTSYELEATPASMDQGKRRGVVAVRLVPTEPAALVAGVELRRRLGPTWLALADQLSVRLSPDGGGLEWPGPESCAAPSR